MPVRIAAVFHVNSDFVRVLTANAQPKTSCAIDLVSCSGLVEQAQTAFTNSERACKSQGMTSDAEKELSRIKRELDAQEQAPGKPPVKQGGWVGGNDEKSKNQSFGAVVVRALLLLGIGATFLIRENLNPRQKTQLSQGANGAVAGVLVGYSVGELGPEY